MLPCLAAIAIATVVGKKTFESHANETSSLLMQNVEALSNPDNGNDGESDVDYPCSMGTPRYARVATTSGKIEFVQHYSDGTDESNGTDEVYTKSFVGCVADGTGSLKGDNFSIPGSRSGSKYQECKGAQGHQSPDFP